MHVKHKTPAGYSRANNKLYFSSQGCVSIRICSFVPWFFNKLARIKKSQGFRKLCFALLILADEVNFSKQCKCRSWVKKIL